MKTNSNFSLLPLALVCALAACASPARAQRTDSSSSAAAPAADTVAQPAAPLPAKPVADKLAPAGWTRYEVGEPARFSLLLPGEPMAKVDRVTIIPGVVASTRTYLSVTGSGVYGVSYLDKLPAALRDDTQKRAFFAGYTKEFAEGFQAGMKNRGLTVSLTMLEQRAASVDGLAGYEQDFSYGNVMGRMRLVFDAGSAYAVVAVWKGLSSDGEISAFFESLKVNTKR
ncbi:MAG TPA: hypothetical protein VGX24_15110 [Pyrinomonadaceae bacterium]|jgi:hypothetical protein|nr:hypothetical protein [Pyrinomonadaceae bacterium]